MKKFIGININRPSAINSERVEIENTNRGRVILHYPVSLALYIEVIEYLLTDNLLSAVKTLRQDTTLGLMESKHYCEAVTYKEMHFIKEYKDEILKEFSDEFI